MDIITSDFGKTLISTFVPAFISVVGFVVTYFKMRHSFKEESIKQKRSITLERMAKIPYDVMQLYNHIMESSNVDDTLKKLNMSRQNEKAYRNRMKKLEDGLFEEMNELYTRIFAYCTKEAVSILAAMQKLNHSMLDSEMESDEVNKYRIMAYYVLLATQIKFDVTSEVVNPKMWYEIKISDFDLVKDDIIRINNEIVSGLGLNKGFTVE